MTEAQAVAIRDAVQIVSENSGVACERIMNFAEDARTAIRTALHRTFPLWPESASQTERYEGVKSAAKVLEEFHGMKG
jgi:hypothetical protein